MNVSITVLNTQAPYENSTVGTTPSAVGYPAGRINKREG